MHGHRIRVWWLDRWASNGPPPRYLEFTGPDHDILGFMDRHEADVLPVVTVLIDEPNPTARGSYTWEAVLLAEGEAGFVLTNGGDWIVGTTPGSRAAGTDFEFRDARGTSRVEATDVVVSRELAFAGLRSWLAGRAEPVVGLEWDVYRNRGRR